MYLHHASIILYISRLEESLCCGKQRRKSIKNKLNKFTKNPFSESTAAKKKAF